MSVQRQHAEYQPERFDPALLAFFESSFRPGRVGLIGTKDAVGILIRKGQRRLVAGRKPSWWNHCFIMGERRWDCRSTDGKPTLSCYIFESALDTDFRDHRNDSGAQENWIGRWCRTDIEHAAVADFGLSDQQCRVVLATALQLVDERIFFPVSELLGAWLAIIRGKQAEENPLDHARGMFCSSFVRYCFRAAGSDFLTEQVSVSNTTPEHVAAAAQRAGGLTIFR